MHYVYVISEQKQLVDNLQGVVTMLNQVTFFATLVGFGFLLGAISGALA